MTTAVDTNVLIDILFMDERFHQISIDKLKEATEDGQSIICEVVMAELSSAFIKKGRDENDLILFLSEANIEFVPSNIEVLFQAGRAWSLYTSKKKSSSICPECGKNIDLVCINCGRKIFWRQHIISDFLIGAHASLHADRLLTRDRGYYKLYFPEINIM